jgi:preprotein translocase subunit YajC
MPMRRKQKRHQEMLSAIKPGDKIVTNGGIYATVTAVGEQTIHVRIADQVKIEVAKSAVAGLQGDPEVETAK